jgi:hypothetical protein
MVLLVAGDADPDGTRGVSFSFLDMNTLGKDVVLKSLAKSFISRANGGPSTKEMRSDPCFGPRY